MALCQRYVASSDGFDMALCQSFMASSEASFEGLVPCGVVPKLATTLWYSFRWPRANLQCSHDGVALFANGLAPIRNRLNSRLVEQLFDRRLRSRGKNSRTKTTNTNT